jgi:hypothetical protein
MPLPLFLITLSDRIVVCLKPTSYSERQLCGPPIQAISGLAAQISETAVASRAFFIVAPPDQYGAGLAQSADDSHVYRYN